MPICNTCLINRQDTHCQRHLCYQCCSSQPYIYQACPSHDIARPPTSIPSSSQPPDRFIPPPRVPNSARPRSSSASHSLDSMLGSNSTSSSAPAASSAASATSPPSASSSSPSAPSPSVTMDVVTALFQRLESTMAADRAAAATAAAAAAAQIAALTNTLTSLTATTSSSTVPITSTSSSAPSSSTSTPSLARAESILGVDPTAINNLIASLSSSSTQVPPTHTVRGTTATTAATSSVDSTTTAASPSGFSSPNPFLLLNDELTAATPGRPEHLIHALTTALTDGSKAAKRFKTKDEFSKALTAQYLSFVSSSSSPSLLSAWYRYTVFLLSLEFQQAQDYHFELSQRMKTGEHDLVRDTHMNNEVYFTCVVQSKRSTGGGKSVGGGGRRTSNRPKSGYHCDMHGDGGHPTSECKGIAAGKKTKG